MATRRLLILILVGVAALLMVFTLSTGSRGVAVEHEELGNASTVYASDLILPSDAVSCSSATTFTQGFTVYQPIVFKDYRECLRMIRLEADYIMASQYINTADSAHGAINNVYGRPTWVVPSENAMAILGLVVASEVLSDAAYLNRAQLAANYLTRVQNLDGAWYDQYSYTHPVELSKSPRQTAEVMTALHKLGYDHNRYSAMKKGAQYLLDCQNVANKSGKDDGLLGGGKNAQGQYQNWRWTHDNAYAYWALKAAESWAIREGENSLASTYNFSAQRIIEGINIYLYEPNTGVWHIAIDANGNPQWISHPENLPSWIQYAPQLLDLPTHGVNSPIVGEWIHNSFQQSDGSCTGYDWENGERSTRKYPGLSFQAALCWFDVGQYMYANAAVKWAKAKGLWQTNPDANGITGGWIDWVEVEPVAGKKAGEWQRFIDTSFYAIASFNGGYNFRIP
jgi:hypothetical protein